MKNNILQKSAAVSAAALLLAGAMAVAAPAKISASANSGTPWWRGTTSTGVTFTGENCPLQVEKEILTFELKDFPKGYGTVEEFLAYEGKVTAEYTFKNPTENEITARLAFPFGDEPDYAPYRDENGNSVKDVDTAKYTVKINDEDAETELRHTYFDGGFNFDKQAARIREGYAEDDFFKTDLPVYKYTFTATVQTNGVFYSVAEIPLDTTKTKIASYSYLHDTKEGALSITWYHQTSASTSFYVLGDDIDTSEIQWKFYTEKYKPSIFGNNWQKVKVSGSAEFGAKEQSTFKEFALKERAEDSAISEKDYYNGVVDYYNNYFTAFLPANGGEAFEYRAMRWFVYDMTVAAGQSVKNTVTVPVYPTIHYAYTPNVYEYEYYLSPAAKWASFGEIEINIKTDYYITEGGSKFEKTEDGYKFTADSLPQGELEFSLCEVQNPKVNKSKFGIFIIVIIVVVLLVLLAILGVIIWAVVYVCRKKQR